VIDAGTYSRYESALADHAFHHIGRLDIRDLRSMQVQEWMNAELRRGYRLATVKGWYRVFRTMVQDAMADLDLPRDPSRRIRFPAAPAREEKNALLPHQLHRFLTEMRQRFPRHFPTGRHPRLHGAALLPRLGAALGGPGLGRGGAPHPAAATAWPRRSCHPGETRAQGISGLSGADGHSEGVRQPPARSRRTSTARLDVPLAHGRPPVPLLAPRPLDRLLAGGRRG